MSDDGSDAYDTDPEHVHESTRRRSHEHTQRVEDMLGDVGMFAEDKYPATSEELAVEYADQEIDLPNETESLGSVFDRLVDERFESPDEAREAVLHELTGEAAGSEEYNDERALGGADEEPIDGTEPLGTVDEDERAR